MIVGALLKLARELEIVTPLLDYSYALLKVLQGRILDERKA